MSAKDELAKLGALTKANSKIMQQFGAFNSAAMAEGALPAKTKELIAVAVALTTQCQYCLEVHTDNARNLGATDEELAEAAWVSAAVRAGGSVMHTANHVIKG